MVLRGISSPMRLSCCCNMKPCALISGNQSSRLSHLDGHISGHCGHTAGCQVLEQVASEICVTQPTDTQQPAKYSASGFQPPRALQARKLFPLKNLNN